MALPRATVVITGRTLRESNDGAGPRRHFKDLTAPDDSVFLSRGSSYADAVAMDRDEALTIANGTPLQDIEGMCRVRGGRSDVIMNAPMHPIDQERIAASRGAVALTHSEYLTQEVQDALATHENKEVRIRMFQSPFATAETLILGYEETVAAAAAEDADIYEGYEEQGAIADNLSTPIELLEQIAADLDSDAKYRASATLARIALDSEDLLTPRARVAAEHERARKREAERVRR